MKQLVELYGTPGEQRKFIQFIRARNAVYPTLKTRFFNHVQRHFNITVPLPARRRSFPDSWRLSELEQIGQAWV